ncbi:MAG TPA: 8-amino-7-oxononanoate synthase [Gammaproteobacteria bacterium]|nr:8-amino-7-oxononanoate synthase [Gammaproteobacteria bacterium]
MSNAAQRLDDLLSPDLEALRARSLYRLRRVVDGPQGAEIHIDGRRYLNFSSNDYLGLAGHPDLRMAARHALDVYGTGCGASHLITGHTRAHAALEAELAEFTQRPRALLFSTGYMANLGVAGALLGRGDRVLADRLNHASLLDAGQLCGARFSRYPHAQTDGSQWQRIQPTGRTLVMTDGVFSMDGDIAPLPDLAQACAAAGAILMVDDAHGFGVLGKHGRGCSEHFDLGLHEVPIYMATLGKALGVFGAFVAGSETLVETLIQHARTYIYTTAMPACLAEANRAALKLVQNEGWRREHLSRLIQQFRVGASQLKLPILNSVTAIQPLLLGKAELAVKVSEQLAERGLLVVAIRPPTVPAGSARLRITLSTAHSEEQIDYLLEALAAVVSQLDH